MLWGLTLLFRYCPGRSIASIVLTVLGGILPSLQLYISKLFVDALIEAFRPDAPSGTFKVLVIMLALQLLALLLSTILSHLDGYVNFAISRELALKLNQDIFKRHAELDYATFNSPEFQNVLSRAQQEGAGRPLSVFRNFISAVKGAITLVGMAGIMLTGPSGNGVGKVIGRYWGIG